MANTIIFDLLFALFLNNIVFLRVFFCSLNAVCVQDLHGTLKKATAERKVDLKIQTKNLFFWVGQEVIQGPFKYKILHMLRDMGVFSYVFLSSLIINYPPICQCVISELCFHFIQVGTVVLKDHVNDKEKYIDNSPMPITIMMMMIYRRRHHHFGQSLMQIMIALAAMYSILTFLLREHIEGSFVGVDNLYILSSQIAGKHLHIHLLKSNKRTTFYHLFLFITLLFSQLLFTLSFYLLIIILLFSFIRHNVHIYTNECEL